MEKTVKPNISPLEQEIEDKLRTAYLFYTASKSKNANLDELIKDRISIAYCPQKSNNTQK